MDAPNASDPTIRTSDGQCLNGGSEGAFFETCDDGAPLQKWEFVPTGATSEALATSDGPDNVPGQIVLASADANTIRPKMCLKGVVEWTVAEGTRVTTVPCDSWDSQYTTWTYAPPPPANKTLLVMPARHAAGAQACVQLKTDGAMQLGDCRDEDLVANWWVQDGGLIRSAAGGSCLYRSSSYVIVLVCNQDDGEQRWSLGADGSLTLTTYPEYGCMTYVGEGYEQFSMRTCTGGGDQNFTFLPAAPTADAVQVV